MVADPLLPSPLRAAALALAAAVVVLACFGCGDDGAPSEPGARPVTLALDFQPNAVHAGIYTAIDERLDRDRGIALEVRVPSSSTDSLKLLAAGRADAAVVDIHDLGLASERGADAVGVGAIVQSPLAAVIARPSVSRPRELEGRRVGVTGLPSDEALLRAVVEADGGDYDAVERTTIGFAAVPSLAAGRVDAVVTFWNAEGVALRRRGVPTREFRVEDFGAPRYPELILVTTSELLDRDPDLVGALREALAEGTAAALADPRAAAARIVEASDADPGLVRAQLRAIDTALRPPLVLRPDALRAWARFDARFGILERPPDVEALFSFSSR